MNTPTLKAGENPAADAAAAEHVNGLYSTGMQFEFAPSTVATRAFLDGFALGAAKLDSAEARVKELEADLTNQKLEAAMEQLAALRAANAELANRLENCMDMLEELEDCDWGDCGMPFTIDWDSLRAVLARHAAGEPAKHPDTERLEGRA